MAHRNANAHLLPVYQVSNAELRRRQIVEADDADFDEAVAAVVAQIVESDPTLSEAQGAARDAGLVLTVEVEPAKNEALDTADLTAYYEAHTITALRSVASKAGMPGAYKGPKKADLVAYCVAVSQLRGVRV